MSWLVWNVLKGPKKHWKGSLICIEMSWKVFDAKRFWMVVKCPKRSPERSWKILKRSKNFLKCTRISERSLNSRRYGMLCVLVFIEGIHQIPLWARLSNKSYKTRLISIVSKPNWFVVKLFL